MRLLCEQPDDRRDMQAPDQECLSSRKRQARSRCAVTTSQTLAISLLSGVGCCDRFAALIDTSMGPQACHSCLDDPDRDVGHATGRLQTP